MSILKKITLVVIGSYLFLSCKSSDTSAVLAIPTITSFSPSTGIVGTQVIITGANFNTTAANNTVKFNGTNATVSSATTTTLTVTVPSGATTGTIAVTNNSQTVTSTANFTVTTPSPSISSFSPTSGLVGSTVTITGGNFSTTATNNVVKFNGTAATVTAATASSLTVTVPSGATSGVLSVTVGGSTVTSTSSYTVTAVTNVMPTITNFTPTSGAVGTVVTLYGTNFSTTPSSNLVTVNGISASVSSSSANALVFTIPNGATTGAIKVKVGTNSVSSTSNFTVSSSSSNVLTNATAKPFFDTYCPGCHASGKSDSNKWLYNPNDYNSSIKGYISILYTDVYVRKSMPQGTSLSSSQLAAFKAWYDAGYPAN